MSIKKTTLRNYARLIARMGINVQKGQEVIIRAELDQPEFVRMVVSECYKAGAAKVTVDWRDQAITKEHYKRQSVKTLGTLEAWEIEKLKLSVDRLPAMIYLISEDPDGLKGVNQEKVAKSQKMLYPIIKPFRDAKDNKYQWCIAAVPGRDWAKTVFPGLRACVAEQKLWETILYTSRADNDDPVAAWKAHNEDLHRRCDYLNSIGISELRYKSANGTDFRVGLIPNSVFMGGSECTLGSNVEYNPNIPSEEIFISPMRGKAEGTVVSTRPLSYRGELIENFTITFHEGKAVECTAEKNEELLRSMLAMDDGAAYLGECALVPYDSPICRSGVTFYNTLFDENACCHLALGFGFTNCLVNYDQYTPEECHAKGINDSIIHEDFMIGSPDLSIDAITADGTSVPIFRDGNWAF